MFKQYRIGFDVWGLVLFLVIMLPNFIWFAVPPLHDPLRAESITATLDTIASVCQVLLVASLCLLINKESEKIGVGPSSIAVIACCLLYYLSWLLYYLVVANAFVILALTIFPCLAFVFFAVNRKNMIALVFALGFTLCHVAYGIINFII